MKTTRIMASVGDAFRRKRTADAWFGVVLVLPAVVVIGFVTFWPLARSIAFGFSDYSLISARPGMEWVGFDNIRRWLESGTAAAVVGQTAVFAVGAVAGQFLLGLGTALLLNQPIRGRAFFRAVFLIPWVLPTVVGALLWMWILNGQYGVFNYVVQQIGLVDEFQAWLMDSRWAMLSVIVVDIWKYFPFDTVILLAGLQSVSPELMDAAKADGANAFQRFLYVTLPSLRYLIVLVLLLTSIWRVQDFSVIWILTAGGPVNATTTLAIQVYRTAFETYDIGLAAGIGVCWLVLQVVVTLVVVKFGLVES